MNITLELQALDDLIIEHTAPPVTAILRNRLHPLREQIEAYIQAQTQVAAELERVKTEHHALKLAQAKPAPQPPADSFANRRGLYYKAGEEIPFCPHCFDATNRKIRLFGPIPMMDETLEYWECHTCDHDYDARPEKNFLASLSRRARKPM